MRLKRTTPQLLSVAKRLLRLLFGGLGHRAHHGITGGHAKLKGEEAHPNVGYGSASLNHSF
jgi:hypothetical protein